MNSMNEISKEIQGASSASKAATGNPVNPRLLAGSKVRKDSQPALATVGDKGASAKGKLDIARLARRNREAILAHNALPATAEDAGRDILVAIPAVAKAEAAVAVMGVARLAIALRPLAVYWASAKVPSADQISPGPGCDLKLLARVKKIAGNSHLVAAKIKIPGTNVQSVSAMPAWRTVSDQTWRTACKGAWLLALSAETRVVIGYAPGDRLPGNTVLEDTEFKKSGKVPALCAPFSLLAPVQFRNIAAKAVNGEYAGLGPVANKDHSLRCLTNDRIGALFAQHFQGAVLAYETSRRDKNVTPTGLLLPWRAARVASKTGTGGKTNGQGTTSLSDALAQFGKKDRTAGVIALADAIKGSRDIPAMAALLKTGEPYKFLAAVFACARIALEKCGDDTLSAERFLNGPAGTELLELRNAVCSRCSDEDRAGNNYTVGRNGKNLKVIAGGSASIIPGEAASRARRNPVEDDGTVAA